MRVFVTLIVGTLLFGCATFPRTPAHPQDDPRFAPTLAQPRGGVPDDRPPRFVLLPGDQIAVQSVSTTTTSVTVALDATGAVHVPLAGDVSISGLSLTEAEAKLKSALQRYDKYIHVNVGLSAASGHTVTVLGAVQTPGVLMLNPGARVGDVLLQAGGVLTTVINGELVSGSDLEAAQLIRDGRPLPIDFRRAMAGDPLHNVFVRAADHIYVPPERGRQIIILGAGGNTVFQWAPGMRLTEALARGGGVPPMGDKNDVRVIRGPMEAPRVYQSSLRDIVDGESYDVEMYPGDIIWVEDHWIEDLGEVMAVISPLVGLTFTFTTLWVALQN